MMALFMAYGILSSALVLVACRLAEKCLASFRCPTRIVWLLGILLAVGLPAIAVVGSTPTPTPPVTNRILSTPAPSGIASDLPSRSTTMPPRFELLSTRLKLIDGPLMWLWLSGSLISLLALALIAIRTRRLMALSENGAVAGAPALVTNQVGPALLGVFRYHIVVPRWVLGLSAEQQSLIVMHEREHALAFDPILVWAAALAVIAFPWNVSLWYMVRRLRASIELDCDARVLESPAQAHAYASLLVDIGARASSRVFFAAALSEPASQLQRRIRAMSPVQPVARIRIAVSAVAALLVLGAAFRAPRPQGPNLAIGRGVQPKGGGLPANSGHASSLAQRNMATALIESESRTPVSVLVFTTRSARIVVSNLSVTLTSDTLRLRTPISLIADLTDGEVHLVSTDGSAIEVTAVFQSSPAAKSIARMSHAILIQGGTGVTAGKAMPPLQVGAPGGPTRVDSGNDIYFEYQVEKPATQMTGTGSPRYPDALRAAGIEGEVQAQFVVDDEGHVEIGTFKVLRSAAFPSKPIRVSTGLPDDMFTAAVREALRSMRYSPAEIGGKRVRQVVQQAFEFKLDDRAKDLAGGRLP